MTDSELERRAYEAEYLIEAVYEDRKNRKLSRRALARHLKWIYEEVLSDCPPEVVQAVQEYEIYIISQQIHLVWQEEASFL